LALAGDPDVIFLDEPTVGFDPEARARCWTVIENLRQLGTTIMLTTHYLDEAEHLADRIAILAGGRIAAMGTSAELAALAGTPTVIELAPTTARQVNLGALDAVTVHDEKGRVTLETMTPSATLRALLAETDDDLVVQPPTLERTYTRLMRAADIVETGVGA
jgi:ABC-2 type transport system ATP-binding protein